VEHARWPGKYAHTAPRRVIFAFRMHCTVVFAHNLPHQRETRCIQSHTIAQTWVETPSVKLLAGREAEQHVRCTARLRLSLFQRVPCFSQIADRAAAVKQALQNDNKNAKLICLQGVCVRQDGAGSGIIGANGGLFNGWYEPVNEFSVSGRVIYVKRGGDAMCIEHHLGKWQLKNLDSKGTGAAFAYVYGACALEACVGKTWHVVFDEDFKALPGVKLLLGEEAEREYVAHAARVAEENARAKPVYISGALGSEADLINGFFEPTQEISGERVVCVRAPSAVLNHSEILTCQVGTRSVATTRRASSIMMAIGKLSLLRTKARTVAAVM